MYPLDPLGGAEEDAFVGRLRAFTAPIARDRGAVVDDVDVLEMNHLLGLDRQDKRSGRSMPVKPWGIVMTNEERAEWEAAGSPTHWNR